MGNLLEIVKRRLNPGILILDLNNNLSYANKEALEILPSFQSKETPKDPGHKIPEEIRVLCDRVKSGKLEGMERGTDCSVIENLSGSSFSLRAFFLSAGETEATHIMVLIEHISEKREMDLEKARRDFGLSKRESEVLRLLCRGLTNKEIAANLFISEYTIKDHIKKIMEKMSVKSRSGIMALLK